jgi:tRNA dimethylallyltransferase
MSTRETPDVPARPAGPVALIAGPTASGKSDLAVRLAEEIERRGARGNRRAVVINADSAQVYADLRVLSARPTAAEMRGIDHRLFGEWDGADPCSAADWAEEAKKEIAAAHASGAVPILVGGTGLYLRTLLDGIAPVPPIHEVVRDSVRAMDTRALYDAVTQEDPGYAAQLARGDRQRLARALEVVRSTGRSLKAWQRDQSGGIGSEIDLFPLILLPEREQLYERCDLRFEAMVHGGAIEEVGALLDRKLDPLLPVMGAIGVRELAGCSQGSWSLPEAIAMGQQATRNYAKRQYTWFRRQPPPKWPRDHSESCDAATSFETLFRHLRLT